MQTFISPVLSENTCCSRKIIKLNVIFKLVLLKAEANRIIATSVTKIVASVKSQRRQRAHLFECVEFINRTRKRIATEQILADSPLTFLCFMDAFAARIAAFLVFCDIMRPKTEIRFVFRYK